ncbi:MAG TPA: hypothetical protein VGP47_05470, partial [Parachlamydiaceae bacterium]|nr:hypothetical protein [Parachlamydiaceae bacterium]
MSISPYVPKTYSQPQTQETLTVEKEVDYNEKIDHLHELVLHSNNPEIHYQSISLIHFKNNRIVKALKTVEQAEEHAKRNGTAPLSIYLALFLRAKYNSSSENIADLKQAWKDLMEISNLEDITIYKKIEIKTLLGLASSKLLAHEKSIIEKTIA